MQASTEMQKAKWGWWVGVLYTDRDQHSHVKLLQRYIGFNCTATEYLSLLSSDNNEEQQQEERGYSVDVFLQYELLFQSNQRYLARRVGITSVGRVG